MDKGRLHGSLGPMRGGRSWRGRGLVVVGSILAGALAAAAPACVGDDPKAGAGADATPDVPTPIADTGADTASPPDGSPDAPRPACDGSTDCDPKNCGRAGHDCEGGACVGGKCGFVELATGQRNPSHLVADGEHVYWVNAGSLALCDGSTSDGAVMRVKRDGTGLATLAQGQACPATIALRAGDVYWAVRGTGAFADGAIRRTPKDGSGSPADVAQVAAAVSFVVDDDALYYTSGAAPNGVFRLPLRLGATPTLMATNQDPLSRLGHNGTELFWSVPIRGDVFRLAKDFTPAGSAGLVPAAYHATGSYPGDVRAQPDGAAVFWANRDEHSIMRLATAGDAGAAPIYPNQGRPRTLVVDDAVYWWTLGQSALYRGSTDGTESARLLAAEKPTNYVNLATDATAIYVAHTDTGRILKLVKP